MRALAWTMALVTALAFTGLALDSPRGPIRIDPETRDVIQTVYVRKVEQRPDGFYNVEFDHFDEQKDPGK